MKYGYTVANRASRRVFDEVAIFIIEELHFKPRNVYPEDFIDGSITREFTSDDGSLVLESDAQVDYVAIISDVKLPIECLHEWTTD